MENIIISSGRRLAIRKSDSLDDWYVSYSPRNDNDCAEGNWKEWVELAHKIIAKDEFSIYKEVPLE
jgi:hypothetical protein